MTLWSCCRGVRTDRTSLSDIEDSDSLRYHRKRRVAEIESVIGRESGLEIFEKRDFVFEKTLGSGANSEVRLLVAVGNKRKFAGKILNGGSVCSLLNEAAIMRNSSLICANIAHLEGIVVNPKMLVLRYYKNGDLGTALVRDNQKFSCDSASDFPFLKRLTYIQDTCKAVDFLHSSNICHRDLSMRNLLLSDDKEHVLLTDFTLSRVVHGSLETQKTITPDISINSPPEVFRHHDGRYYSLKSDIWGLGIAMFEIIEKKQFVQPRYGKYKMPTELPKKWLPSKEVFAKGQFLWFQILRCWNTDPKKRPWSWEVLGEITKMVKNPRICHANDGYFNRFETCTSGNSNTIPTRVSTCKYWPPTLTGRDLLIERTWTGDVLESITSEFTLSSATDWNSTHKLPRSITTPDINVRMANTLGPTNSGPCPHLLTVRNLRPHRSQFKLTTNLSLVSSTTSINSSLMSTSFPEFSSSRINNQYCDPKQYCSPLTFTPDSDVTNIRFCKDRHFFDAAAMKIVNQAEIVPPDCCMHDFNGTEESSSQEVILQTKLEPAIESFTEGTEMAPTIIPESSSDSEIPVVTILSSSNRKNNYDKLLKIDEIHTGLNSNDFSSSMQESILEKCDSNPMRWQYVK